MPDCASSDGDLMRAVKKDDSFALVELIGRWETRLLAFIYRFVQNESVARDLVQETFVRIYDSRQRYDIEKPFSTWMFTIAANLCRNHQRWILRHNETSMESAGEPIDPGTPADSLAGKDRQRRIAEAIAELPHALRLTVLLYYYEDQSYKEIAEITGCSIRGVESRLYRARKILWRALKDESEFSPTASLAKGSKLTI